MAEQTLTSLSTTDILDKEFRTELRGYSTTEVDDFLDEIINDYTKMYKEIARLTEENNSLKQALAAKPKAPVGTVAPPAAESLENTAQGSNYDVLRRVSLLEKQVMEIMEHLRKRAQQDAARKVSQQPE